VRYHNGHFIELSGGSARAVRAKSACSLVWWSSVSRRAWSPHTLEIANADQAKFFMTVGLE
jgi:hypothetical protein